MKAILSVIGKDKLGIIASVSKELSDLKINIEDISQTIMQDYFTMIMLVDTGKCTLPFDDVSKRLSELGRKSNLDIRLRHEDIFNAMHKL